MLAALSTALTMSYSVRAATLAAVSASISTPVTPRVRTVACTTTLSRCGSRSTVTLLNGNGWHRGTSSGVRLAAMMPAIRATARASPLGRSPFASSSTTSGRVTSTAWAVASRDVTAFSLTSTMCAVPSSRTCVRRCGVLSSG